MQIRTPAKSFEVWRTLDLQPLRFGSHTWGLKQVQDYYFCKKNEVRWEAFGNCHPRGTVPSRGSVSFALVTAEDFGLDPTDDYSYNDLLHRGKALGLESVQPGLILQLYAGGGLEDLFDTYAVLMSEPTDVPDSADPEKLSVLKIGRDSEGLYIGSIDLLDPDDASHFGGGRTMIFKLE